MRDNLDVTSELEMLHGYLRAQRRHILGALDSLGETDLRRAMLPTGWTFLGLINHLAVDVERFWFRAVIAAESGVVAAYEAGPSHAWVVPQERAASEVLEGYRAESERADRIIEATPANAPPKWWWPGQDGPHVTDLRETVLHVLVETSTHAGHLDAARELFDGRTWLVID